MLCYLRLCVARSSGHRCKKEKSRVTAEVSNYILICIANFGSAFGSKLSWFFCIQLLWIQTCWGPCTLLMSWREDLVREYKWVIGQLWCKEPSKSHFFTVNTHVFFLLVRLMIVLPFRLIFLGQCRQEVLEQYGKLVERQVFCCFESYPECDVIHLKSFKSHSGRYIWKWDRQKSLGF